MRVSRVVKAAHSREPVSGLTHNFYRYPARFSPQFVRAAIEAYTNPGDIVIDPFMGSGATLVEAKALGRCAVGTDISQLATFLTRVKTTILENRELAEVRAWAEKAAAVLSPRTPTPRHVDWYESGYQRNLPWRIRKMAEQALNLSAILPRRSEAFARCALLRSLQWAVDGTRTAPPVGTFRSRFMRHVDEMIEGMRAFRAQASMNRPPGRRVQIYVANRPATDLPWLPTGLIKKGRAKLIVTSPPYLGVHVLYHRWQVAGRRETPAPFWIANCKDGAGASYYTLGDRKRKDKSYYFDSIRRTFEAVRSVTHSESIVVQLVGFANPRHDLPCYLQTMELAGFSELRANSQEPHGDDGRTWRVVPNRRWHATLKGRTHSCREVMLAHRAI